MRRRADLMLLWAALGFSFATGVLALWVGTGKAWLVVWAHGAGGMAVILLVWSKLGVIRRGLDRRWPNVGLSLVAALAAVAMIGAGLAHSMGLGNLGPFTALGWHIAFALALLPLVVVHLVTRPVRPRRGDLTRAAFLRAGALLVGAVAVKAVFEATLGAPRAATGSLPVSSPRPTVWLNDPTPQIDPASYRLRAGHTVHTPASLAALPQHEVTCRLDCTSGWYATGRWRGVLVSDLLGSAPAGTRSLQVRSHTGYSRRFDPGIAGAMLLATHLDGEPLSAGMGAPVRLVVPGRRGFWWVKWVTAVEPSTEPAWWQAPFPV
jgi:molybdopterin-dependent oxidoreductase-like protein protein